VTGRDESSEPTDVVLLGRARAGDRAAIERLVTRNQGVVYRYLLAFLKDEDQAADTAQDTFLKALDRLDGFRGASSFRTWLLAIAKHEAIGRMRSQRRRREESLEQPELVADGSAGPDQLAMWADETKRIRATLERLPEKQRMCVSLRLFDGLSHKAIGELTDSTEAAARVNYHYGISRLREWLDEDTR
jgi:RNA polymerase sigma-70 factor (ECF subfamily)